MNVKIQIIITNFWQIFGGFLDDFCEYLGDDFWLIFDDHFG